MDDSIQHGQSLYLFDNDDSFSNNEHNSKVFETNEPIRKFINQLQNKAEQQKSYSATHNFMKTAPIYYSHRLVHVNKKTRRFSYSIFDITYGTKVLAVHFSVTQKQKAIRKTQNFSLFPNMG